MKWELDGWLKIFGIALGVAVLTLGWIWPAFLSEMVLMALAVWMALSNFARIVKEKRTVMAKVDIKR